MKKTIKKSLVLSILSATVWMSVPSDIFAAQPSIANRLEALRARREASRQQAIVLADNVETEQRLQARAADLETTRNAVIDQAFDAIGQAEEQIENLLVVARRHRYDQMEKKATFQAAQNAIAQLAGRISTLRIKAAESDVYQRQLANAEAQLDRYEQDLREVQSTLNTAFG